MGTKLPESAIKHKKLITLAEGQSGYIVPWKLEVDTDWNVYIDPATVYADTLGGTVSTEVLRTSEGYKVRLSKHYKYDEAFFSSREKLLSKGYVPVVEVLEG